MQFHFMINRSVRFEPLLDKRGTMKRTLLAAVMFSTSAVTLTGCVVVNAPAAAPTTSTATPTKTKDPYFAAEAEKITTPKQFPITGNIAADLETGGMIPGKDYQPMFESAKTALCDPVNSDTSPNFKKLVERFDAAKPELVRIAIAYGCPDRLAPAWTYINKTYMKY